MNPLATGRATSSLANSYEFYFGKRKTMRSHNECEAQRKSLMEFCRPLEPEIEGLILAIIELCRTIDDVTERIVSALEGPR